MFIETEYISLKPSSDSATEGENLFLYIFTLVFAWRVVKQTATELDSTETTQNGKIWFTNNSQTKQSNQQ